MCSGTGLVMTTLSDASLQTFFAVTVQITSVPGMTLVSAAATSTLDFSPLTLTTSFSTSPVVLSSTQLVCANAGACSAQAMTAAAMNFTVPLIMCVSFTSM